MNLPTTTELVLAETSRIEGLIRALEDTETYAEIEWSDRFRAHSYATVVIRHMEPRIMDHFHNRADVRDLDQYVWGIGSSMERLEGRAVSLGIKGHHREAEALMAYVEVIQRALSPLVAYALSADL